jgi:hypothetical protein
VTFILRRSDGGQFDILADVDLYFNQVPGKLFIHLRTSLHNFPCVD